MTTSQLIDALVAHYGSREAVNAACADIWQDGNGNRTMLKVDALWELYNHLNAPVAKQDA